MILQCSYCKEPIFLGNDGGPSKTVKLFPELFKGKATDYRECMECEMIFCDRCMIELKGKCSACGKTVAF